MICFREQAVTLTSIRRYRACGKFGWTPTERYVEIFEFTHFTELWTFHEVGENHKEKVKDYLERNTL